METFKVISGNELSPLKIRKNIGEYDREISFIKEVNSCFSNDLVYIEYNESPLDHELYTTMNLVEDFNKSNLYVCTDSKIKLQIQSDPTLKQKYSKIQVLEYSTPIFNNQKKIIKITNETVSIPTLKCVPNVAIIIDDMSRAKGAADNKVNIQNFNRLEFMNKYLYIRLDLWTDFCNKFKYYITKNSIDELVLNYDNLVHLLIMVKDAGDSFRQVLIDNLPYFDRWTILDTGSTDNTIDIINEVLVDKKPGNLYREPFINFRESRNRCIELAGKSCVFNIMLDDTYVLRGNIREFLSVARCDNIVDSYSIFIRGDDTHYTSNRIAKSARNLKYIYTIHEVLQDNLNVSIPTKDIPGLPANLYSIYIEDRMSKYMEDRTNTRKLKDLEWLFDEIKNDPENPKHIYYIAETYLCVKDYKNAYDYYKKRAEFVSKTGKGHSEEVQDSLYKMGALGHYYLQNSWEQSFQELLKCYEYDKNRPESLFVIAAYFKSIGDISSAYKYAKTAFETPDPILANYCMNLKVDIYRYHIPKMLLELAYIMQDVQLSYDCAKKILEHRKDDELIKSWLKILESLMYANSLYPSGLSDPDGPKGPKIKYANTSKTICFVEASSWIKWDGETYYKEGLGGSESYIIKTAEEIAKNTDYTVIVFCNTKIPFKIYNDVIYLPIAEYIKFLSIYRVDVCFINRYVEYIPVTTFFDIDTYCILHDLLRENELIAPTNPQKLKGILCISEWHKNYFIEKLPSFKNITRSISYGIDLDTLPTETKQKNSFIYSSFPTRGLYWLLKMFPKIVEKYPDAKLNVFCNTKHHFAQEVNKQMMDEIDIMLDEQKEYVTNHGWVPKNILREFWAKSHIWLYPCIFHETCCLTAYEAAATKTLAISNNLAALEESIGDRGICIPGNPETPEWRDKTLNEVFKVLESDSVSYYEDLINKNYEWVKNKKYEIVTQDFIEKYISNDVSEESKQ